MLKRLWWLEDLAERGFKATLGFLLKPAVLILVGVLAGGYGLWKLAAVAVLGGGLAVSFGLLKLETDCACFATLTLVLTMIASMMIGLGR